MIAKRYNRIKEIVDNAMNNQNEQYNEINNLKLENLKLEK